MLLEVLAFARMTSFIRGEEIPAFAGIVMRNNSINDFSLYSLYISEIATWEYGNILFTILLKN